MTRRRILIDCDETLVPSSHLYIRANDWCMEILAQAFGDEMPDADDVRDLRHDYDVGLMGLYEYHLERFPNSWAMTYSWLLKRLDRPMDDNVFQRLMQASRTFRDGPFVTYPGVPDALNVLAQRRHELIMVTAAKYAEEFQLSKIEQAGLLPHFGERIVITGVDKSADYERLLVGLPDRGVVIGDSSAHDIAPGRAHGAWTIKVGDNRWKHTHADVEPDFSVDTFAETPAIIQQL